MDRLKQRQGFLVSVTLHLVLLMALASRPPEKRPERKTIAPPEPPRKVVFLPSAEELRRLLPPSLAPRPRPQPSPAPERPKSRISIGPPSAERAKGPLILRKEDDLTAVPKGKPSAQPSPQPAPPAQAASSEAQPGGAAGVKGAAGLPFPDTGAGTQPRGDQGSMARPGAQEPSIASSLRSLERRLQDSGPTGLPSGTGQQLGPLFFDPEGADFTFWINTFKNEVYRNWIVPQPALLGMRGHVDIEFVVERDGALSSLKVLKSSGTPALDRAAQNALLGSRLPPLPADFAPPRVTMQATFFYNEGPAGS